VKGRERKKRARGGGRARGGLLRIWRKTIVLWVIFTWRFFQVL